MPLYAYSESAECMPDLDVTNSRFVFRRRDTGGRLQSADGCPPLSLSTSARFQQPHKAGLWIGHWEKKEASMLDWYQIWYRRPDLGQTES